MGSSGFLISGETGASLDGQPYVGDRDAFVRRMTDSGSVLWTQQIGSPGDELATTLATDSNEAFVVGGWTTHDAAAPPTARDGVVEWRDLDDGQLLWRSLVATSLEDIVWDAALTPDGIVVAGTVDGTLPGETPSGGRDIFVRKYDLAGNELWTTQLGTSARDDALSIAVAPSGRIALSGETAGAFPGQTFHGGFGDALLVVLEANGDLAWVRQFGSDDREIGRGVAFGPSGEVVVGGETDGTMPGETSAGLGDVFLARFTDTGDSIDVTQIGTDGFDSADGSLAAYPSGYAISGRTVGQGVLCARFDLSGALLDLAVMSVGEMALDSDARSTGELVIAGETRGPGDYDAFAATIPPL